MLASLCRSSLPIAAFAVFVASTAAAHSGAGNLLFVAEDGRDEGGCVDEHAPCASLGYALSVAGKGAEIRVAAGTYPIEDSEDLFLLVSGLSEAVGGFARRGGFVADPEGVSTLIGLPAEYRQLLQDRGFNVVPDRKGTEGSQVAEAEKLVALHGKLKSGTTIAACAGGMAGDLECQSVDLVAHFAFSRLSAPATSATDVWGFVDLNTAREYAIVGYDIGTAVIDVTDPENPAEVGFVGGQTAGWRDIKVYQFFDPAADRWRAYAYVTADGTTDGLFVIDLSGLPHGIRKVNHSSDFFSAHNVYLTNTDYSTGIALTDAPPLLAISGSNIGDGRYRGYSLADPADPAFVAAAPSAGYMHDASSFIITDTRKDTQCPNGGERCEVLLDFNEQEFNVWDISKPSEPLRLSETTYAGAAYVHSGSWSQDRQFVFVHDERDEQQGLQTTLRIFSLADLSLPVQVGTWTGPTGAIDHNGFVRGNRYYMSTYSRGLTVLDITDPSTPIDVGHLDTYPFSNRTAFVGAWGAYPFYFSNTIAVSDIDSGLFLARDRSVEVPQGSFSFSASSFAAREGETVRLTVERTGGTVGEVAVGFEILHATARSDDYLAPGGELSWSGGDASTRTIDIPLVNDDVPENLERFFVRLVNPRGRATLGERNVASVYVSDPGAAPGIGFFTDSAEVTERGFAQAVLVLRRSGSAVAPASVEFFVSGGDAGAGSDFAGPANGTVTWDAGDGEPRNLVFPIIDDGIVEETEHFEVTLANASGADLTGSTTATVSILDGDGRPATVSPAAPGGGGGAAVALFFLCGLAASGAALRRRGAV